MKQPLLLVAAGGLGREVAEAARAGDRWQPIGFVDDNPDRFGDDVDGIPVLGGLDAVAAHRDAYVVVCAGNGAARLALVQRLNGLLTPERYATVVHPGVRVPGSARIGVGTVLLAGTVLTAAVTLGRHVVCMPNVVLTHDDVVEDVATLCAGVTLGGRVRIGTGAYLGMSASIRPGVQIGAGSVIGMGAVVLADVPAGQTWVGVPAKVLCQEGF